ncbi:MAG: hypothetical protein P4L65_06265 [Legionella sp.]|nr:hypothetical protein [Legionella sp.]
MPQTSPPAPEYTNTPTHNVPIASSIDITEDVTEANAHNEFDLQSLDTFFNAAHNGTSFYTPAPRLTYSPAAPQYRIATINKLHVLLDELKKINDWDFEDYHETTSEYNEKYSIRYLVTREMQILFAPEGRPSNTIPGHKQMASSCLAAGNIFFSKDFSRITKITNCSGDFLPFDISIIWPLMILTLCPILNSDNSEYFFIKTSSGIQAKINKEKMQELIPDIIRNAILLAHQEIPQFPVFAAIPAPAAATERDPYSTPPSSPKKKKRNDERTNFLMMQGLLERVIAQVTHQESLVAEPQELVQLEPLNMDVVEQEEHVAPLAADNSSGSAQQASSMMASNPRFFSLTKKHKMVQVQGCHDDEEVQLRIKRAK